MQRKALFILIIILIFTCSLIRYSKSPVRTANEKYSKVIQFAGSESLGKETNLFPAGASTNLYLVDFRFITESLDEAVFYYKQEGVRLSLKEFHVDSYSIAESKFGEKWSLKFLGFSEEQKDSILVLSQFYEVE